MNRLSLLLPPPESCQPDQPGAEKQQGGRFRDRFLADVGDKDAAGRDFRGVGRDFRDVGNPDSPSKK
jgi:hypothetical protein